MWFTAKDISEICEIKDSIKMVSRAIIATPFLYWNNYVTKLPDYENTFCGVLLALLQ